MSEYKRNALAIFKLPEGGYVVRDWRLVEDNMPRDFLFACTHMDEALAFIRKQLGSQP